MCLWLQIVREAALLPRWGDAGGTERHTASTTAKVLRSQGCPKKIEAEVGGLRDRVQAAKDCDLLRPS